jgi:c(7)-type cytochrome triheme protein
MSSNYPEHGPQARPGHRLWPHKTTLMQSLKPVRRLIVMLLAIICASMSLAQGLLRPVPIKPPPANEFRSVPHAPDELPAQDMNQFYDAANPDLYKLQKSSEAAATLPLDKKGAIDWMTALRSGAITPRAALSGDVKMTVLDLDIVMRNTKEMPYVKFPHNSHTQWLACSNCHDKIFVPKAGANDINMSKIFSGQFCGACHDRVAFLTTYSCERCHSVPHGDVKAWW